jgi:hypothetical protein
MNTQANEKDFLIEVDSISLPIFIFHGETTDIPSNISFSVDENGIRTLLTPEEKAKEILFNSVVQTREEQELIKRVQSENGIENSLVEIEMDCGDKTLIKNSRYNLSLLFNGYSESGKAKFIVVQDTISGNFRETSELLSNSKIITNQLNLF